MAADDERIVVIEPLANDAWDQVAGAVDPRMNCDPKGVVPNLEVTGAGSVRVYERSAGEWSEHELDLPLEPGPVRSMPPDELIPEQYRAGAFPTYSAAISGDWIAVGMAGDGTATPFGGSVHLYQRIQGTWLKRHSIVEADVRANDLFGAEVALSDDMLVVAAPGDDNPPYGPTDSGSVYVYQLGDHAPVRIDRLRAGFPDTAAAFGTSLAISEDWLAVGAPLEDREPASLNADASSNSAKDDGTVYLYRREGTKLHATQPAHGVNAFGISLSLSGNELAVGAPFAQGCGAAPYLRGAAFVYSLDASRKPEELKCLQPRDKGGAAFGRSVKLSLDQLTVGAPFSTGRAIEPVGAPAPSASEPLYDSTGTVYVFGRTESGEWEDEPCAIKAPNLDACDAFGYSVAGGTDFIVAGAPLEDGSNAGVGGNGGDNALLDSGAFYVLSPAGGAATTRAAGRAGVRSGHSSDVAWREPMTWK